MPDPEYNLKRKKIDFAKWASKWLTERRSPSRMHELHRRNRESKRMHEEALHDVSVELRDESQNFDAIIYAEDDTVLEYVEVTVVPQEDDHNLRHDLADKGQYSLVTILTHNPSLTAYSSLVSDAIHKKPGKEYPTPTTLLVALSAEMIVEEDDRFDLVIARIDPSITAGKFSKIMILDEPSTHCHTINAA
jgi:hypothetical protein